MGELIREDQKRRAKEKLDAVLMEGLNSGPRLAADAQFWEGLRKEARARRAARKKKALLRAPGWIAGECVYFGEQSGVELAERASPGPRGCPVGGFEKDQTFYSPGPSGIDRSACCMGGKLSGCCFDEEA